MLLSTEVRTTALVLELPHKAFFQLLDTFPHNKKSYLNDSVWLDTAHLTAQLPGPLAFLPRVIKVELQLSIQNLQ